LINNIVCFWTLLQPSFTNVIVDPQYKQVTTISPNFGAMGALQLGHLSAVASEGAIIEAVELPVGFDLSMAIFVPHFKQKSASSGRSAPQWGNTWSSHSTAQFTVREHSPS
jgi:hypothetical protein